MTPCCVAIHNQKDNKNPYKNYQMHHNNLVTMAFGCSFSTSVHMGEKAPEPDHEPNQRQASFSGHS